MNLAHWYHKKKHQGGLVLGKEDHRDFALGGIFGYAPKSIRTNNASKLLGYRNQKGINVCVCVSGTTGKEADEGCPLDDQVIVNLLVSRGQMNEEGTSLSAFQKALQDYGVPEKQGEINYDQSFQTFAGQKKYQDYVGNAAIHKTQTFYRALDIGRVLQDLDNGKFGHAGGSWYTGYNAGELNALAIFEPNKGYNVGGHATLICDYDTDYHGFKVLKIRNSYGQDYGKDGYFYVKFEDFHAIFSAGAYFNTDLAKDIVSWLSLHQGKLVKEKNGPRIYLIQGDHKRHIPDEAMLLMLEQSWEEDTDMLSLVQDGPDVSVGDVPLEKLKRYHDTVLYTTIPTLKEAFLKYFPDIH